MTFKTLAAALALTLAPVLGLAQGCDHGRQVMSCADGMIYDSTTGTCVQSVNS